MVYPPAPWKLKGQAVQTLHLIDTDRVRSLVPSELDIFEVWPGKTLGGVYIASYEAGSMLQYNELIVMAATARNGMQVGTWVSHIYVDNPDSVAGGREIWGLPKQMAEFTWERGTPSTVTVRQGDRLLCNLSYSETFWRLPVPLLSVPNFSILDSNLLLFPGELQSHLRLIDAKLHIPPESPFSSLDMGHNWLSLSCEDLRILAGVPKVVRETATRPTYAPI